jgi:hypothetical protein
VFESQAPPRLKSLIIGIDPGFTGAIALFNPDTKTVIDVYDMPLTSPGILDGTYGAGRSSARPEICPVKLAKIIGPLSKRIAMAVVERVHASPDAGVTSMFRFGEGYGLLIGTLHGLGIERVLTPVSSVWKVSMGLSRDKKLSLEAVGQYLGVDTQKRYCPLLKHHGRAEAILLCLYGSKAMKSLSQGN